MTQRFKNCVLRFWDISSFRAVLGITTSSAHHKTSGAKFQIKHQLKPNITNRKKDNKVKAEIINSKKYKVLRLHKKFKGTFHSSDIWAK